MLRFTPKKSGSRALYNNNPLDRNAMFTSRKLVRLLLSPITRFMGRISYIKKFTLTCAIFAVPFTFSTVMILLHSQEKIDALSEKVTVIERLRNIHEINTDLINIRNLYAQNLSNPNITKRSVIDKLTTLMSVLKLSPNTPTYRSLVQLQASTQTEFEGIITEGSSLYSRLNDIDNILLQVNQLEELFVSDHGFFNDDDSYSLNLVSLITYYFNSPISSMEKTKITGASVLKLGYVDSQGIYSLQQLKNTLDSDYTRLSLRISNTYNSSQFSNQQYTTYNRLLNGIIAINRLIEDSITFDPSLSTDPIQFMVQCDESIQKIQKVQEHLVDALTSRYSERIGDLKQQQILNIAYIGLTFLIATYLLLGIFSSIEHSLIALISASKRLFHGDLSTPITLETKDEMFELACYFEAMRIKLKEKGDELHEATIRDALTGLYNRRDFDDFLGHHLQQCEADNSDLILLIIDLDHFKNINDQHGHLVGDQCLQQTARLLLEAITRNGDRVFRYGGEEFAIILPPISNTNGSVIAERICQLFRSHTLTAPPINFTASIGIASTKSTHTYDATALIGYADSALYAAKDAGRDRFIIYQESSL